MRALTRSAVALLSLITSAVTGSASVAVSPNETAVGRVTYGPADHHQSHPAIAGNGEIFLAVWANSYAATAEVYAARMNRHGELLDRPAFPIAAGPRIGTMPHAAWSGRYFLVASQSSAGIRLTRVTPEGEIAGERTMENARIGSLTCNTSRCLLVFTTWQDGFHLASVLLDAEGNAAGAQQTIVPVPGTLQDVATATTGSGFLVTWRHFDSSAAHRYVLNISAVTSLGTPGPVRTVVATSSYLGSHAVASHGLGYLLAWDAGTNLASQRVSAAGFLEGARAVESVPDFLPFGPVEMIATPDGYLVVTAEKPSRLVSRTIGQGGTPATEVITESYSTERGMLALGASGGTILAIWTEPSLTGADLYGRVLDSTGGDERVRVSESARPQRYPAAASDGEMVLTVWEEVEGSQSEIRGALSRGASGAATNFLVAAADPMLKQPQVAFNGSEYVVVWSSRASERSVEAAILAQRVSRTGEAIDASPIVITSRSCRAPFSVASDGRDVLVVWTDCDQSRVVASRIASGAAVDHSIVANPARGTIDAGEIAWSGQHYVVTWVEREYSQVLCDPPCYDATTRAARVSSAGVVLDPGGITIAKQESSYGARPYAVSNGEYVLVLWREYGVIRGAPVRADGTTGPANPLVATDQKPVAEPLSVAWTGSSFLLAWTWVHEDAGDVMLASITPTHVATGATAPVFAMATTADPESRPIVLPIGPRRVVLAYQRVAHEPEYGSANRLFLRSLQFVGRVRSVRR